MFSRLKKHPLTRLDEFKFSKTAQKKQVPRASACLRGTTCASSPRLSWAILRAPLSSAGGGRFRSSTRLVATFLGPRGSSQTQSGCRNIGPCGLVRWGSLNDVKSLLMLHSSSRCPLGCIAGFLSSLWFRLLRSWFLSLAAEAERAFLLQAEDR